MWVFFIMDLMVQNRWLCNNVCGKKLWNNLEVRNGTWMGLEEGNLGHWTWYYSCACLVTKLSIQHNSKLDIKVQSLIRVKV